MRRLPWILAVLLAVPALAQTPPPAPPDTRSQAVRDAERDLWTPGQGRSLRSWWVKGAAAPEPDEAGLAPVAPEQEGWSLHAAWTDMVELDPPGEAAEQPRYLYAYATVTRAEAGPAELSVGARVPLRLWVNGEAVGTVEGAPALARDSVRLPVRLRQGENRILLRAGPGGVPARLTVRLLAPSQPVRAAFAPFLTPAADHRFDVRTDSARGADRAHVTVLAPGGRTVAKIEVRRGDSVRFDGADWRDGPYEVRVAASDAFGAPQTAWLSWYKGDPAPAARRLLARAAAAAADDGEGAHWRLLAALLVDRAGADLSALPHHRELVHSVLMEAAELELGSAAILRPSGFVRLAWIDAVDGSAQFCRAYLPRGYDASRTWPTVVNLHGFNPPNPPYLRFWSVDRRHDESADRWDVVWIEPHGRGNAQYVGIGERDVLNCLDAAQRRLAVDPDRTYLTGESMGGSGTWLIGSRHADRFAAIAPIFGGWDFRLQPGSGFDNPAANRPMERWAAEVQSSFASAEQLVNTPVFVHHGDGDAAVDVRFSRHIVQRLQRWGYDIRYREYPGWAHEDLQYRDQTVAWMLRHRRADTPRNVRIRATDLDSASAWWLRVDGAERPMEVIEADAEFIEPGLLRLDTRNVAALTLSPPPAIAGSGRLRVVWNGRALERSVEEGQVRLVATDAPQGRRLKRAGLGGGLSDAFSTPFVIVVGTAARDPEMRRLLQEKAEALAGLWQSWQHVRPRLVTDTALTPEMERSLTLVLLGGPNENAIARRLSRQLPLRIDPRSVTIDGRRFAAEDAVVDLIYPSPLADGRYVMLVAGTSPRGFALWEPASYWHPVIGFRTNAYDWTLRDARAPQLEPGLLPERGWIAAGVFDQSWRRDDRWTFEGDAALRASVQPAG